MANAYTIYFPFQGATCKAVVYRLPGKTTVYLTDERLQGILPDERLQLQAEGTAVIEPQQSELARDLVSTIANRVNNNVH